MAAQSEGHVSSPVCLPVPGIQQMLTSHKDRGAPRAE